MAGKKNKRQKTITPTAYTPAERVLALFNQAESLFSQQIYDQAREIFNSIVNEDKYFHPALRQLGIAELRLGNSPEAIKYLLKYIKFEPLDPVAQANIAQAYLTSGQPSKARQHIHKAINQTSNADFYFLAASIDEQMCEWDKAANSYLKGLNIDPERRSAKLALATALKNNKDFAAAAEVLEELTEKDPQDFNARTNLGNLYHSIGAFELAVNCFEQALSDTKHADTLYNLGLSHLQLRNPQKSIDAFAETLSLEPHHQEAQIQMAEALSSLGQFDRAIQTLNEIPIDKGFHCRSEYLKSQLQRHTEHHTELSDELRSLLSKENDRDNRIMLNFALAKIYDDTGQYESAFKSAFEANRIKFKSVKSAANEYINKLDTALSDISEIPEGQSATDTDTRTPIFIVGMPRSGTTLLESFVSANDGIVACGEIDYFGPALYRFQHRLAEFGKSGLDGFSAAELRKGYLQRIGSGVNGAKYFVDKTPDNFKYFSLLSKLFPHARFIHCRRHALDTGLSIFFQLFEGLAYSYDLKSIGRCINRSDEIIERQQHSSPDQWLTVDYEMLVQQPQDTAAALSQFLHMDCSADSAASTNVDSPINTMSKWQARQAFYERSINRWQHYEKHLGELRNELNPKLVRAQSNRIK